MKYDVLMTLVVEATDESEAQRVAESFRTGLVASYLPREKAEFLYVGVNEQTGDKLREHFETRGETPVPIVFETPS